MSTEPGLRERKKQRTRRLIADTAHRLFAERGFDAVTVADVAREADVSEGTVFNYFATKEQLFWGEMESFEAALVEAVRTRPAGESLAAAFRRFIVERSERLAVDEVAALITTAARIVGDSPTLQAREREIVAEYTRELAASIAEETGAAPDDVEPAVAAEALMAAHRVLVAYVRAGVRAGRHGRELADDLQVQAERAFALLERGLAGYPATRR